MSPTAGGEDVLMGFLLYVFFDFSERLGFKAMAHLMRMIMVYSKQKGSKLQPEILTLTFYWSLLYISMYNYYIIMLKT